MACWKWNGRHGATPGRSREDSRPIATLGEARALRDIGMTRDRSRLRPSMRGPSLGSPCSGRGVEPPTQAGFDRTGPIGAPLVAVGREPAGFELGSDRAGTGTCIVGRPRRPPAKAAAKTRKNKPAARPFWPRGGLPFLDPRCPSSNLPVRPEVSRLGPSLSRAFARSLQMSPRERGFIKVLQPGVPSCRRVSGRFPFRRSRASRYSNAMLSLFTSARPQVPQPEDLRAGGPFERPRVGKNPTERIVASPRLRVTPFAVILREFRLTAARTVGPRAGSLPRARLSTSPPPPTGAPHRCDPSRATRRLSPCHPPAADSPTVPLRRHRFPCS